MAKVWRVEFKVRSRSTLSPTFPLDMLRYDSCYPDKQQDVSDMIFTPGEVFEEEELPIITLVHNSHGNKKWEPTRARWQSFGWEVISVEVREGY